MNEFMISDDQFWSCIKDSFDEFGGVYILKPYDQAKSPRAIERLLSHDLDGILYIGKTSSFLERVIELKKSLSPGYTSSGHECGFRHKSHPGISSKFPYESLYVTLEKSDNPRVREEELLRRYFNSYGELPPLNRSN